MLRPNRARILFGVRTVPDLGCPGAPQQGQDVLRVPFQFLVRVGAQRELELAVRVYVGHAKARRLPARQRVRLVSRHQAEEAALDDDEQTDVGVVAPGFALHPGAASEGAAGHAEQFGHAHGSGESPAVVDVETNRVRFTRAHFRRLLRERHQQFLGQAPVDEGAELRARGHPKEGHLAKLQLGNPRGGQRSALGVQRDEDSHLVAHLRQVRDFWADQQQRGGLGAGAFLGQEGPRAAKAPDFQGGEATEQGAEGL